MNENLIRIYDSTGATPINDVGHFLDRIQDVRFSTVYPGGIFKSLTFFVPCDISGHHPFAHNQQVQVKNGLKTLWEGRIISIAYALSKDQQGLEIEAAGCWIFATQSKYKYNRWIDRRYSSPIYGVWSPKLDSTAPDKCTYDQNNRLYFVPKATAWTSGEYAAIYYDTNGSSSVKRVTFSYDFQEAAQAWELRLYDSQNSTALWTVSASGTGTQDITLGTASAFLRFEFTAKANQTPAADGTIYGKITNLACVAETWDSTYSTTVTDMLQDMVHYFGTDVFADDYTFIAVNTYDMLSTGFVADDLSESLGAQMKRLGTFSATNDAYSVGCFESDAIPNNTKAVVYYEKIPDLTDYEYVVDLSGRNLAGIELVTSSSPSELYNDVYVVHTDSNGKTQWSNSNDDSQLADQDSIAKYGSHVHIIRGGQSATLAGAGVFGRPYVKLHKDLQYYMRGPLILTGTIKKKNGISVPCSHIRAGERIKIKNFVSDIGGTLGSGLTFLITNTDYDDESGTLSVTTGVPDDLAIYLAKREVSG